MRVIIGSVGFVLALGALWWIAGKPDNYLPRSLRQAPAADVQPGH